MENPEVELSPPFKFTWRIPKFSKMEDGPHYSDIFMAGGRKWRVLIYPKGHMGMNHLSLYLYYAERSTDKLSYVECKLAVLNQVNSDYTMTKEGQTHFSTKIRSMGYLSVLPLSDLNDPSKGYLVNDTLIIGAEVSACSIWKNSKDYSCKGISSEQIKAELQSEQPVERDRVQILSEPKPEKETKLGGKITDPIVAYPGAGQPFEGGAKQDHKSFVLDEKFEDIGGFSVLKTQATLYKQIWLKYGHIASSQVPTAWSYIGQVWLVADIMGSIMIMEQCSLPDVSFKMIDLWENKIKMAEKLEFNIRWLRDQFETVKRCFYGMKKFKTSILEV